MKNWQTRYLPLFSVLLLVVALGYFRETPVAELRHETSAPPKKYEPKRIPAQLKQKSEKNSIDNTSDDRAGRKPASVPKTDFSRIIVPDTRVKLSPGMTLTGNIIAIPKQDWHPGMKPFLSTFGAYGFYEKSPGEQGIPVVYNSVQNKFYPVSSILHISSVDSMKRQELLDQGHTEYLYMKKLKLLSLRSTSESVIETYDQLKRQGHSVRIEVIREQPKSR